MSDKAPSKKPWFHDVYLRDIYVATRADRPELVVAMGVSESSVRLGRSDLSIKQVGMALEEDFPQNYLWWMGRNRLRYDVPDPGVIDPRHQALYTWLRDATFGALGTDIAQLIFLDFLCLAAPEARDDAVSWVSHGQMYCDLPMHPAHHHNEEIPHEGVNRVMTERLLLVIEDLSQPLPTDDTVVHLDALRPGAMAVGQALLLAALTEALFDILHRAGRGREVKTAMEHAMRAIRLVGKRMRLWRHVIDRWQASAQGSGSQMVDDIWEQWADLRVRGSSGASLAASMIGELLV